MAKPIFIMLVGLPGSGKSTYRSDYDFGTFVHISTDDLTEVRAKELRATYDEVWSDYIAQASVEAQQSFQDAVKLRKDIVWDQTNLSPKKRRGAMSQLPKHYLKIAVYFEIDEELRQHRTAGRVGKTVPDSIIDSMRQSYVRPSVEEGFDFVLDGSEPLANFRGAA
jgi:predicted kinase